MPVLVLLLIAAAASGVVVLVEHARHSRVDPGAPRLDPGAITDEVHRHPRLRAALRRWRPGTATGVAIASAAAVLVVGAVLIGVLAAMVHTNRGLVVYDAGVTRWAARHATSGSTRVLRTITQLGGAYVVIPLAVVVAVIETVRLRRWSVWPFLTLAVGGQFLVANTVKFVVDRARPDLDPLTGFSGASFPSGHATAAAATYAAFALLAGARRSRAVRTAAFAVAVGLALLIGGTRVMLGVHWMTDVIGGLLLGWTWFTICSIAFGGRMLRFAVPADVAAEEAARPTLSVG